MTTHFAHLLTGNLSAFEAAAAKLEDNRPHPEEAALDQLGSAIVTELLDVLADTALEDFLPQIVEGVIGGFHSVIERLGRDADRFRGEARRLMQDMDGSEVTDHKLQEATRKFTAVDVAVMAVEIARDAAAANYTVQTGEVWTPWRGSVRPSRATAAMIDAKDALRTIAQRNRKDLDPGQIVVAFRGSPNANQEGDANRVFDALNWAKAKFPDMTLATSGAQGAEKLALSWARQKKVPVVLAKPEFAKHGAAAPFKANDEILAFDPVLVLTLPNSLSADAGAKPSGVVLNLGQKAEQAGIRHQVITHRRQAAA